MKGYSLLIISIFFCFSTMISQNDINQFDSQGKRQGVWERKYEKSDQIRYSGQFNHGKEIGVFKYYCKDCLSKPSVIKTFNDQDNSAFVKYLTKKGKVISEGKMIGKNRIDEWIYYHKNSNVIMTKEYYKNGKLDGQKITYYLTNKIAEEVIYENGIKQGKNNYYSPTGVLLKKLLYKNDELHGPVTYYDGSGNITLEGNYKEGKKHGIWKTYKNGKFIKEEVFPKPRVRN
ncbi:MAG: hypothetical protein L3J09_09035 [Flavobacteriaceae bacterium]|nr:hypothetical protein [Flavobacteriaceae bacterium]